MAASNCDRKSHRGGRVAQAVLGERPAPQAAGGSAAAPFPEDEERAIAIALAILERRARYLAERPTLSSPSAVREYLRLKLAGLEYEAFWCVFLNTKNQAIAMEEMFRGTLSEAPVYPREVAKRALALNAAALIVAHNHPSGDANPSEADRAVTRRLKDALALLDIKLLDHFIVAQGQMRSFAEIGLI